MEVTTIAQIEERLRQLPPDILGVVLDFVSYLAERRLAFEAFQTMLASEPVLRRDWDRPEGEGAWRFGELPEAAVSQIEQQDADWCEAMGVRAMSAQSLQELGLAPKEPDNGTL